MARESSPEGTPFPFPRRAARRAAVLPSPSEALLGGLFAQEALGVAELDLRTGRALRFNARLGALLGFGPDDPRARQLVLLAGADRRRPAARRLAGLAPTRAREPALKRHDGSFLPVRLVRLPLDRAARGRVLLLVVDDASAGPSLAGAERNYRDIYDNISEGIYRSSLDGRQLSANPALVRLNGYETEAEMLAAVSDIGAEWYVDPERRREFQRVLERDGRVENFVSEVHRHKTRERIWISENARLVRDPATGAPLYYEGTVREVTETVRRLELEERHRRLAFFDPLTGLPNRRLLLDRLAEACAAVEKEETGQGGEAGHGAVLFLDLDHFKLVNDTRGHDVGDLMLAEVARRIESCVRPGDTVARLGGDEFVILLRVAEAESAERVARAVGARVLEAVGAPLELRGETFRITPSIGIALLGDPAATPEALLQRADIAMYQAKTGGRNRLRLFDPAMQAGLERRLMLVNDLREAVARGELALHVQPQYDRARRLVGAEVLLRWSHPVLGCVPPAEFVPLAEETGQIGPIFRWAFAAGCAALRPWLRGGGAFRLAFNVSPHQLRESGFARDVRVALAEEGVPAERLVFELTESVMLDDIERAVARLRELRALGIGFALDDFGTGFSSLMRLRSLPMDELKIDASFVRDLESSHGDRTMVRTIIAMARGLGLAVVAEGVETEGQFRILAEEGCGLFQGFLLGRPEPIESFAARHGAG